MDDNSALVAERIARNLPVKNLRVCRADSANGEVYYAYGRGINEKHEECWHGVWFSDAMGGIGQTLEFHKKAKEKAVRQSLYDHAVVSLI